jgi:hypothetical protein
MHQSSASFRSGARSIVVQSQDASAVPLGRDDNVRGATEEQVAARVPARPEDVFRASSAPGRGLDVTSGGEAPHRKVAGHVKRARIPDRSAGAAGKDPATAAIAVQAAVDEASTAEVTPVPVVDQTFTGDASTFQAYADAQSSGARSAAPTTYAPSAPRAGRPQGGRGRNASAAFVSKPPSRGGGDGKGERRWAGGRNSTAVSEGEGEGGSEENPTSADGAASSRFSGIVMDRVAVAAAEAAGNFDNLTRVSYMMYRLIKTHHIASLVDIPCTNTLHWMPQVLHYLDFEVPGFRYTCVVPTEADRELAQASFGEQASPEYLVAREYWRLKLPATDMAFLWNILGFIPPQQSWALLKSVRQAQTKYVVLPNYPQLRNNPATGTHHGRVNVRRAPYRFAEALRVFNNISTSAKITKQMLFYDTEHLRQDDL